MKLLRKKLTVNFSKQCAGFLLQIIFWWLQANVLNNYTIEKGKGKTVQFLNAIFKENLITHALLEEKNVLLICNKNEINHEILADKKSIFVESLSFFYILFFFLAKS